MLRVARFKTGVVTNFLFVFVLDFTDGLSGSIDSVFCRCVDVGVTCTVLYGSVAFTVVGSPLIPPCPCKDEAENQRSSWFYSYRSMANDNRCAVLSRAGSGQAQFLARHRAVLYGMQSKLQMRMRSLC